MTPDMKELMSSSGLDIVGGTPAHFREVLKSDIAKWQKVVSVANIKVAN